MRFKKKRAAAQKQQGNDTRLFVPLLTHLLAFIHL
jgi:hypothetical protein